MKKAFTLLELLIVTAIIAILAVIVFVSLDPLTRFKSARDVTRWADISTIVAAIKANQTDHNGNYISAISELTNGNFYTIGTCTLEGDNGCTAKKTQPACLDLNELVISGHLSIIPKDPLTGTVKKTGYYFSKASDETITVGVCDGESTKDISVSQ
ncbi:MAG: type II secretion system protein [Patescibacteria group bacterium]